MPDNHDQAVVTNEWVIAPTEPLSLAVVEAGSLAIAEARQALAPIVVGLVALLEQREAIVAEMQTLEEAGLCEATLVAEWRQSGDGVEPHGPYYRLVYPTDKQGWRRREYIGNKPERVAEARAALARYLRYGELNTELHWLEQDLGCIRVHLGQVQELLRKRC